MSITKVDARGPGLQVVGSGFGRTGTLSTKAALEVLGFGPCHHMKEVLASNAQASHWARVARGEPVDWTEVLAGYRSTVDFPSSVKWKEIWAAYPDAKVLHTVRDPERWYESTYETIYQARRVAPKWMAKALPPVRNRGLASNGIVWEQLFEGRFEDRAFAIERFEQWTDDVIAAVPPERLLVFEVKDGWEPLCAFLGVDVPTTPFPHVNDRDQMLRQIAVAKAALRVGPVAAGAALAGGMALVRRVAARRSV